MNLSLTLLTTTSTAIDTVDGLFGVVSDIIEGMVGQLTTLLTAVTSNVFFVIPFAMAMVGLAIRFFWKLFGR